MESFTDNHNPSPNEITGTITTTTNTKDNITNIADSNNNKNPLPSPSPIPPDLFNLPSALIGVVSPFDTNYLFTCSPSPDMCSTSSSDSYAAERAAYAAASDEEKRHFENGLVVREIKFMRENLAVLGQDDGDGDAGDGSAGATDGRMDEVGNGKEEDKVVEGEGVVEKWERLGDVADRLWCRLRDLYCEAKEDEKEEQQKRMYMELEQKGDHVYAANTEENYFDKGKGRAEDATGSQALVIQEQSTGLSIDSHPDIPATYEEWLENSLREAEDERDRAVVSRDEMVARHQALKAAHAQLSRALIQGPAGDKWKDEVIDDYKYLADEWAKLFAASELQNQAAMQLVDNKNAAIAILEATRAEFTRAVGKDLLNKWVPDEDHEEALQDLEEMIEYDEICNATLEEPASVVAYGASTWREDRELSEAKSLVSAELEQKKIEDGFETEGEESPDVCELMMMGVRASMALVWSLLELLGWNNE